MTIEWRKLPISTIFKHSTKWQKDAFSYKVNVKGYSSRILSASAAFVALPRVPLCVPHFYGFTLKYMSSFLDSVLTLLKVYLFQWEYFLSLKCHQKWEHHMNKKKIACTGNRANRNGSFKAKERKNCRKIIENDQGALENCQILLHWLALFMLFNKTDPYVLSLFL